VDSEGVLQGGYDVDVILATLQFGVLLDPSFGALQQGVARANGIMVKSTLTPTQAQCTSQALAKNGVSLALDAAGFIPGESTFNAALQVGVGVTSTVYSATQGDTTGSIMGAAGTGLSVFGPIAKQAGWGVAKAVPWAGTLLNVAGTVKDVNSFDADFQSCLAGN
jgi:hypothetical protein